MPVVRRTQEEDLMEVRKKILEEKREYLCSYLNPETHIPYLRSVYILTKDDQDIIRHEITDKAKANKFLDILLTRGPDTYQHLVTSLKKDKTQMFIVETLNKEYEKRKSIYLGGDTSLSQKVELVVDVKQLPKPQKCPTNHSIKIEETMLYTRSGQENEQTENKSDKTVPEQGQPGCSSLENTQVKGDNS